MRTAGGNGVGDATSKIVRLAGRKMNHVQSKPGPTGKAFAEKKLHQMNVRGCHSSESCIHVREGKLKSCFANSLVPLETFERRVIPLHAGTRLPRITLCPTINPPVRIGLAVVQHNLPSSNPCLTKSSSSSHIPIYSNHDHAAPISQ